MGLAPGDVVGGARYRICRELGRGGMGIVYEAEDTKLNRQVALKTHQIGSPAARAQLLVEAQAMAKLSHPNVVAVHDVGEFDGGVFLVAELVTGGSLKTWRVPERSWQEVVRAYVEAGRGLAYAHEAGLVHRDFKPGNVLRTRNGRCQVADFGIAVSSLASGHTRDAEATRPDAGSETEYNLAGTPAYMAPEVLMDACVDARSDQFSFSVALYEALLGKRPFEFLSIELLEGKPRDLPRGPVPLRVVRVLERGFAVRPSDRHPSMTELLDGLERSVAPQRRGWLAVGAVALTGAGTWAALANVEPPCEVDPVPLPTWTSEGRDSLASVFARDREAERQWPSVVRRVDAFVERWIEASTELCDGGPTDAYRLEAARCLEDLRRDAEATLASLQRASGAAARNASSRAEAWTSPAMCLRRDVAAASKGSPLFQRPRYTAIRQQLREISSELESGGDVDALSARLDALRPEIAALDDPDLRARLLFTEGAVALRTDRTKLEPLLKRAYQEARAADDNLLATVAANRLTHLLATELGDSKSALEWGEVARAEAHRDGVYDDVVVRTELVAAIAYDVAGMWDEAADGYDRALLEAEKVEGETRERLRAEILISVSGFEFARGNPERALSTGTEAVETFERLDGGPSRNSFAAMGNVGLALASADRLQEAREMFEREYRLRAELLGPDHPEQFVALLNLGMIADHQNRHEDARRQWMEADALLVRYYGERHADRGDIALNLGWHDMKAQRFAEAEERFLWAKDVLEETVGPGAEQTFLAQVALASARLALGRVEQACAPIPGLVNEARQTLGDNRVVARLLRVDGDCAATRGELDEATAKLRESLSLSERISDAVGERLDIQLALAKVLAENGSMDEARELAEEVASHASTPATTRARAQALQWPAVTPRRATFRGLPKTATPSPWCASTGLRSASGSRNAPARCRDSCGTSSKRSSPAETSSTASWWPSAAAAATACASRSPARAAASALRAWAGAWPRPRRSWSSTACLRFRGGSGC